MTYRFSIAALVLNLLISGQLSNSQSQRKYEQTIRGHIENKQNKGIPDALLKLYACDPDHGNCDKGPVKLARSGHDGSFILNTAGVKAGVYSLEATSPPVYFPKARQPVMIPDDSSKTFDFIMLTDTRYAQGPLNIDDVSEEDAKEIYAAARIEHDQQLEALSTMIMDQQWQQEQRKLPQTAQAQMPSESAVAVTNIRSAFRESPSLASSDISVDVRDHVIELSGDVPSEDAKDSAERIAKVYAKNMKVKSHLEVAEYDSLEGCLSGSSGNFTLTESSGKSWQLAGDTSKLTEHVGHQVRLTGTEAAGAGDGASSAAGSSASSGATSTSARSTFTVSKTKMISSSCPTSR